MIISANDTFLSILQLHFHFLLSIYYAFYQLTYIYLLYSKKTKKLL
jgi:hypothetical protein